jgi:hypothetical protein
MISKSCLCFNGFQRKTGELSESFSLDNHALDLCFTFESTCLWFRDLVKIEIWVKKYFACLPSFSNHFEVRIVLLFRAFLCFIKVIGHFKCWHHMHFHGCSKHSKYLISLSSRLFLLNFQTHANYVQNLDFSLLLYRY